MSFGSVDFVLFFTCSVLVYFVLPKQLKNVWLLGCSFYFYYSFTTRYLLLLGCVVVGTYLWAHLLAKANSAFLRKGLLFVGSCSLLGVLVVTKYYQMLTQTAAAAGLKLPALAIYGQPLGVSFFVLVAVGYLVDQYRKKYKPESDLIRFGVLITFFPLISSGPIERGGDLLPQLKTPARFDYERVRRGLSRMLWGYFKKFVVADTLAISVDKVFGQEGTVTVTGFSGPFLCLAALLFAYQLYCDFSGYSDIAIGACQVLGLKVRENFVRPFFAKNFSDLWDGWHISLSTWFRDYLYFPLGGSRKGLLRTYINVMVVFLVSGLWHGANWKFALWGAANGVFVVLSKWYTRKGRPLERYNPLRRTPVLCRLWQFACCFGIFSFCFILFRANTFADAIYVYTHLLDGWLGAVINPGATIASLKAMNIGRKFLLLMVPSIALLEYVQWREACTGRQMTDLLFSRPVPVRVVFWYYQLLMLAFFGALGSSNFIYFGF